MRAGGPSISGGDGHKLQPDFSPRRPQQWIRLFFEANKQANCVGGRRKEGEGNGTQLQASCLENPMDGGAWWAAVHGVAKSQTQLSDFTFTTGEENGNPLQCSCLENPRDRRAWWASVYGVAQSRTRLMRRSSSSSIISSSSSSSRN